MFTEHPPNIQQTSTAHQHPPETIEHLLKIYSNIYWTSIENLSNIYRTSIEHLSKTYRKTPIEHLSNIYRTSIEHLSKIYTNLSKTYRKSIEPLSKIYRKSVENLLKICRKPVENLSTIQNTKTAQYRATRHEIKDFWYEAIDVFKIYRFRYARERETSK